MLSDRVRPSLHLFAAKPVLASLLLFFQAAPHTEASPEHLRFQRSISYTSQDNVQACAVLDAAVFTHASPALKDLRIYSGSTEIPYAITLSEPLQTDTDDARVLNLGSRAGHIVFDLAMPRRAYTAVALEIAAQDFIATAEVSGSQTLDDPKPTGLGSFTLFDLTSQHLSHSTTLKLSESSFPYLHVDLSLAAAPGNAASAATLNQPEIVKSASVPPSREAQTVYTTLQQSSTLIQLGHKSVATFQVPARVPIERVAFTLAPAYKGSFSRPVRVEARVVPNQKYDTSGGGASEAETAPRDDRPSSTETVLGTILSVHKLEAGREIAQETLSVPTAIGANMQQLAEIQVAIENGDDAPLPVASVQLKMRQRRVCFDASAHSPVTLFYGDASLEAPVYDYAKLFQPSATPLPATLSPEETNATFTPRADARPFTERHPELLWIALLAVVSILALTAFRSAKKLPR